MQSLNTLPGCSVAAAWALLGSSPGISNARARAEALPKVVRETVGRRVGVGMATSIWGKKWRFKVAGAAGS